MLAAESKFPRCLGSIIINYQVLGKDFEHKVLIKAEQLMQLMVWEWTPVSPQVVCGPGWEGLPHIPGSCHVSPLDSKGSSA